MTILVHPELSVPHELVSQYERTLASLAAHTLSHGLNIELMHSRARVYSVRINHKARLLIAPYRDELGKVSWVILDCLDEHKYQSIYLSMGQAELEQRILALRPGKSTPLTFPAQPATAQLVIEQELVFYQSMVIQLTTEQNEVVNAELPLVVNGVAGSGKTCVGLSTLRQAALAWEEGAPPIVYVATSPKLIVQMKQNYQLAYGADEHVLFLTYQQVLEYILRGSITGFVNDEDLSVWLTGYIQKHKQLSKFSTDALCREFRQVCLCRELQDYLEIGARHSLLADEVKKEVFTAYQAYRADLTQRKLVHPDLYHDALRPLFSMVVADESQDLSPAALTTLSQIVHRDSIKRAPQIMYLADANQSLENGNLLVLHHLIRLVREENIKTLPVSHRCPEEVIEVANRLLTLRNSISGGVYDKYTQSSLRRQKGECRGEVQWVDHLQAEWTSLSEDPNFAVVTSADYLEEASEKFNTPLIFTPAQIKGLEYHYIVVYRLFGEEVKSINDKLRKEGVNSSSNRVRRDELTQEHVSKAIYLNEVFTAFTRALHTLIIFQTIEHYNQDIIKFLYPDAAKRTGTVSPTLTNNLSLDSANEAVSATTTKMSGAAVCAPDNLAAWQAELARQEALGNHQVASSIQRKLTKLTKLTKPRTETESASSSVVETKSIDPLRRSAPLPQLITEVVTPPTTIPVQNNPTVIRPLGPALSQYVEKFLREMRAGKSKQNEQNVKSFLEHARAYTLLFIHPMNNERTLFENLVTFGLYSTFIACMEKLDLKDTYLALLRQAVNHLATPMSILIKILILEWDASNKLIFERWQQNVEEKVLCLHELINSQTNIGLLALGGLTLISKQWSYFKSFFTSEFINQTIETGNYKGLSYLFILVCTPEGIQFLNKQWKDIEPLLTPEGFNRRVIEAGDNKGKSAFFFLAALLEGIQLLKAKWGGIKRLLTKEGLNGSVGEGADKGKCPLILLACRPEGMQLLQDKWGDIQPLLTNEGLNSAVESGEGAGKSFLYCLVSSSMGRRLLKDNWNQIIPFFTLEGFNRVVEAGEDKGKSPLYFLASTSDGLQLLQEKWNDVKPFLTKKVLNRVVEVGPHQGITPLMCFAEHARLLNDRWDEIRPFITKEGFNSASEVGGYKGQSLCFLLSSSEEGRALLNDKWGDISPLLSKEGLNRVARTRHGIEISPLLFLVSDPNWLEDKWNEVKSFFTVDDLNRVTREATAYKLTIVLPKINELIQKLIDEKLAASSKHRFHPPALLVLDQLDTVSALQPN